MNTHGAMVCRATVTLTMILLAFSGAAQAWVSVGDGIEYQKFTTPEPNNVFVCRMLRTNTNATLETTMANGKLSGGRQVTSAQAALIDDAISWWGEEWGARNDVVCAVNGAYETEVASFPDGQQIHSGWYAKRISEWGWSGFGWTVDRLPFIGGCIHTTTAMNYITVLPEGNQVSFTNVNTTRGTSDIIIYTPQYDSTTLTDNTGVEWVVKMDRPTLILPSPNRAEGTVTEIRVNLGSTPIPWDCIVISATGANATLLQSYLSVGKRVGITQYFLEYEPNCSTPKTNYWTKTFASIGGNVTFLRNGVVVHNYQDGMVARNPRTCIAYNADYVFYVVCDGRSTTSVGWTNDEMAAFCLNTLGATDGINEDGGGSSVMVVNGTIMNSPSDGSERAVVNGTTMVNVSPKLQSSTFGVGQTVTVNTATTAVRLGPGSNYASLGTKGKNTTGTVVSHGFNGVYAKGFCWWKVDFGSGLIGWVAETLISSASTGPTILQHPTSQTACDGDSVKFVIAATGKTSLSYKWQKNSVDISDGGHYSGTATPQLLISSITSSEYASYRCRVTDSVGSVYTNSATLTQGSQPSAPAAQPASNVGADSITWNWGVAPGAQYYQLWTAASGGTQVNGSISANFYTESGLDPATTYTRYVESWGCGSSATRTQLGPVATSARYCPENAGYEDWAVSSMPDHWAKIADDGTSVYSKETSIVHGGTSSLRISDPTAGQSYTGWAYQKLNVQPSRQYTLSYWHYHTGLDGQTTGFVTGIGCDVNGGTSLVSIGESMGPLNQWLLKKSSPFTSGTAGRITIGVRGGANNGGTVGYADDMALAPAPPTASGGTATICAGQSATISASGGFGGASSEVHWYTGPGGTGTHVGTGTTRSVSPTVTTTYYPRWESASSCGSCCFSEDGPSVTITVNAAPSAPTGAVANPASISPGGSSTLSATVAGGVTIDWYTGSCGGVLAGSGTSIVVSPSSTTTYYPRARNTTTGCVSSACGSPVTVTVLQDPPTVTATTPYSGPNTGTTSITNLAGTNFVSGASVKLSRIGYADISASSVVVAAPTQITCLLDLTGKKTGLWDVVVTNPDTQSGTLAGGFGVTIPSTAPAVGTTIGSLLDAVAVPGSLNYQFCVWGVVETIDSSTFWLDDGSGTRIKVFAPGYSISGIYASAIGTVDVGSGTPVLVSSPGTVRGY